MKLIELNNKNKISKKEKFKEKDWRNFKKSRFKI